MATNTDSDAAMTSAEPHLCALGQKQRLPANIQISLHRRQNSLSQYQSTCISKHYALNNQILTAFESHYRNGLLKVAFHLGLKFVETALLEIPVSSFALLSCNFLHHLVIVAFILHTHRFVWRRFSLFFVYGYNAVETVRFCSLF